MQEGRCRHCRQIKSLYNSGNCPGCAHKRMVDNMLRGRKPDED